jgi:hypothetical protein
MNPYILMPQQQDVSGLQPVYQNIAAQQLMHDQALAQQNQQVQQAGQKPSGGGMNPMALAQMLRKPQTAAPVTDYSQPMPQYLDPAYMQAGY